MFLSQFSAVVDLMKSSPTYDNVLHTKAQTLPAFSHSSTPGWAKLKRSTDLSSNLRRRQRIYDQDQSFFINNNKTKSKSKSFKHFAKSTLAQGAQIQLKILVTPLTVPAMRLERRHGNETEGLRPQRTSLAWLAWSAYLINAISWNHVSIDT